MLDKILNNSFIIFTFINIVFSQSLENYDNFLEQGNFEEIIKKLEYLNIKNSNKKDVLISLSIAHHYLSEQSIQTKDDKYNAKKSFKYIKKAYSLYPEDANVLKWYVIALGKNVEDESIRKQIEQSKNIEKLSLKVIELLPNDEFCYNIMGQWHYKLASLGKASRRIASFLFSEPPQGSFEQATYFLEKSLELNPDYVGTYYWLGKTHLKLGNKEKAYDLFNKGILLDRPFKREEKIYQDIKNIVKKNN